MSTEDNRLEVVLNKKGGFFYAKCPLFPNCTGIGETERDALKELSHLISEKVHQSISQSLEDILLSGEYEEFILDPTREEGDAEHKLFSYKKSLPFQKKLHISLPPSDFASKMSSRPANDIRNLFEPRSLQEIAFTKGEQANKQDKPPLLFGITLCLN